jgi:predicted DNA-binding transcriptional regulator AlpA
MGGTLLRLDEVHERTGIPVRTLRDWRYRGIGPRSYRLGRRVVYDVADLETWLAEQRGQAVAPS